LVGRRGQRPTNPHVQTTSTNLELRFTLTENPKKRYVSIYSTDLHRGRIIPIFGNQSIGRIVRAHGLVGRKTEKPSFDGKILRSNMHPPARPRYFAHSYEPSSLPMIKRLVLLSSACLIFLNRTVDIRLPGKRISNSHGARPVHQIITMIKWIRTRGLLIKKSLSLTRLPHFAERLPSRPSWRFRTCLDGQRLTRLDGQRLTPVEYEGFVSPQFQGVT